jgi:hypothetical protein
MGLSPEAKSKLIPVAVWAALILALGLLLWFSAAKSDTRVFRVDGSSWGEWRVRRESETSKRLLLAQLRAGWGESQRYLTGKVYRYDPAEASITEVPVKLWHQTSGTALDADMIPPDKVRPCAAITDGIVEASCGGPASGTLEVVGEAAVAIDWAPTGKLMAILTADGASQPPSRAWVNAWTGNTNAYNGQHYVELFSIPDLKPAREAVRIPFTTMTGLDPPCWTADGGYVVYSSIDGKRVCIIRTDAGEEY